MHTSASLAVSGNRCPTPPPAAGASSPGRRLSPVPPEPQARLGSPAPGAAAVLEPQELGRGAWRRAGAAMETAQALARATLFRSSGIDWTLASGVEIQHRVSSPDGRWLAAAWCRADRPQAVSVQLWDTWPARPEERGCVEYSGEPRAWLQFSGSGNRLQILLSTGKRAVWIRQEADHWLRSPSVPLFTGLIACVESNPCGSLMAASRLSDLQLVYGGDRDDRAPVGLWRREWEDADCWRCLNMRCSGDSRHFVMAQKDATWLFDYEGTDWQEQRIDCTPPAPRWWSPASWRCGAAAAMAADTLPDQAFFDQGSRQLAVASFTALLAGRSVPFSVRLWRFEEPQGWHRVSAPGTREPLVLSARASALGDYAIALAFSPDGSLLALPAPDSLQDVRLLPTWGTGAWTASITLPCGRLRTEDGAAEAEADAIVSLKFNDTGRYLAVGTWAGLHIWGRPSEQGWHKVLQLASCHPGISIQVSFSPDGHHCALAMGHRGEISVWGPDSEGCYSCKLVWMWKEWVHRLAFAGPDRLLIVSGETEESRDRVPGITVEADRLSASRLGGLSLMPATL